MSDDTIEVPVTRHARTTLIGRIAELQVRGAVITMCGEERLRPGDMFALRASPESPWRSGFGRVHDAALDLRAIHSAAHGDLVYRIEPQETP